LAEAERLRQSLLADAGRGDLLKTIRPSFWSARSSWFWRRQDAGFLNMTDGATMPAFSDAARRRVSLQCSRMISVLMR
jgi:hypothetical protein